MRITSAFAICMLLSAQARVVGDEDPQLKAQVERLTSTFVDALRSSRLHWSSRAIEQGARVFSEVLSECLTRPLTAQRESHAARLLASDGLRYLLARWKAKREGDIVPADMPSNPAQDAQCAVSAGRLALLIAQWAQRPELDDRQITQIRQQVSTIVSTLRESSGQTFSEVGIDPGQALAFTARALEAELNSPLSPFLKRVLTKQELDHLLATCRAELPKVVTDAANRLASSSAAGAPAPRPVHIWRHADTATIEFLTRSQYVGMAVATWIMEHWTSHRMVAPHSLTEAAKKASDLVVAERRKQLRKWTYLRRLREATVYPRAAAQALLEYFITDIATTFASREVKCAFSLGTPGKNHTGGEPK